MWICSKFGFFSIVKKVDGYHVRARSKKDLENLSSQVPLAKKLMIETWPKADYRYRIIVPLAWPSLMSDIFLAFSNSINYPNFKSEIASNKLGQCAKLGDYTDFHSNMAMYQDEEDER